MWYRDWSGTRRSEGPSKESRGSLAAAFEYANDN
jgi:hypothetical protein